MLVWNRGFLKSRSAALLAFALAGIWAGEAAAEGFTATWGNNSSGQLGDGATGTNTNAPGPVTTSGALSGKTVTQISAGGSHTCAVTSDGGAYCWGDNGSGQLGDGTNANSSVPVAVTTGGALSGKTVTQIDAGGSHTCAVTSDGGAYCWGANWAGQLGDATNSNSNVPVAVTTGGALSGKTVTQIDTGNTFTCAVTSDGGAYCWGNNASGELGNGTNTNSNVPVAVATGGALSGKTLTQISAGGFHTCTLTSDGGAYCWGANFAGQLGDATNSDSNVPVAVTTGGALSGKTLTQISAGRFVACGLSSDGGAYCWGFNGDGELGNGASGTSENVPVAVTTGGALSGKRVVQISVGFGACALTSDGGAYCWGWNYYSQLGDLSNTDSNVPVQVAGASGVPSAAFISQISAGNFHTAAVAIAGGPGRSIAAGLSSTWQPMGLTCTPSGGQTVADIFGSGSAMDLTSGQYNAANPGASQGWVVWRHNPSTNQYVRLAPTDTLSLGTGYWFRSYQSGRQGRLIMTCPSTAPSAPVTQGQGCASANGCVAIALTSAAGVDRSNLLGNPFPYAIDWSQVRVRIDGTGSFTPSQAARLAGSGKAPFAAISNTFNVWNGTSYASYSDSGVTAGQLPYFGSFWVKVLSGSFGHTVELLIPNLPTQTASPF